MKSSVLYFNAYKLQMIYNNVKKIDYKDVYNLNK